MFDIKILCVLSKRYFRVSASFFRQAPDALTPEYHNSGLDATNRYHSLRRIHCVPMVIALVLFETRCLGCAQPDLKQVVPFIVCRSAWQLYHTDSVNPPSHPITATVRWDQIGEHQRTGKLCFVTYYTHIPCMILSIWNISLKLMFCNCNSEPVSLLRGRECIIFTYYLDTLNESKIWNTRVVCIAGGTWHSSGRSSDPSNAARNAAAGC